METLGLIVVGKKLLLSVSVGLLVGIERHISKGYIKTYIGMRDFMLVSVLAFLASYLNSFNTYIWPLAFLLVIAISITAFVFNTLFDKKVGGTTTLITIPVVFLASSISMQNFDFWLIVTLVFILIIILELKTEWYDIITTFTKKEILDFSVFMAIAIIITPLIPEKAVLNLGFYIMPIAKIWKIVVLISLVSFVGHFVGKHIKGRNAILIASFFGGLVSSLATIALFLKGNADGQMKRRNIMLAFLAATSGSLIKDILLFYTTVSYAFFQQMLLPMVSIFVALVAGAIIIFTKSDAESVKITERPMPLSFIFKFSGFLVSIILIMAAIKQYLPTYMFAIASFFSGMASSGPAIVAIGDGMTQSPELITTFVAGISLILAITGSTFAKYLVIMKSVGFQRSWMFIVPVAGIGLIGAATLFLALQPS